MTDLKPDSEPVSVDPTEAQVTEVRERLAAEGYPGRFDVDDNRVWCNACRSHLAIHDIRWRVVEVIAAPQAMKLVGGIRCPICHELGTAVNELRTN